ncbi:hypothetical protein GCM10027275_17290 [Rhabdobacter roseus]|uniref:Outer membrane murein-binding lipoprotein Lpp n=1 Tax=Rhabdobacter roseus TaxID=1655419 RepID=A0A840TQZ1_9BACT|nr:hypothetical protein [Rhabdobacter roseus]MBB5283653.1 outer membrane murein-binding lipoprotein Lpp [Rhabdobacter roseus]
MAESEKSIGGKIWGFFVKEASEQPVATPPPSPVAAPAPATVRDTAGTRDIDRKFVDHFVELLAKANLPGPDYFEFKQALQSMQGLGLSEEKQFQAAWASFKAMGGLTDLAVLTTTAGQYLTVLDKDRAAFLKDVERALAERVGSLNDELKKLQQDNKAFAEQITALQAKINANNERIGQISGEVEAQSARIHENRDGYELAHQSFVQQIHSDNDKIKKYLN